MRVKYLAEEHNTMTRPGLEPGTLNPKSSPLTIRQPRLPHLLGYLPVCLCVFCIVYTFNLTEFVILHQILFPFKRKVLP